MQIKKAIERMKSYKQMHTDDYFDLAINSLEKQLYGTLVEVVRCKVCTHSDKIRKVGNGITEPPYIVVYRCDISELGMQEDDFCSYGDRI
jgi:hypothetical protein